MHTHADLTKANLDLQLQRKTRFEPGELQVEGSSTHAVDFTVEVSLRLYGSHKTTQYPGRSQPGPADVLAHSSADANRAIQNECHSALDRTGLLQDVLDRFGSQPVTSQSGDAEVESHPRQVYHTFSCPGCGGRGRIRCGNCGGAGTVFHSPCGGSGRITEKVKEQRTYNGQTSYVYRDVTRACNCQNGRFLARTAMAPVNSIAGPVVRPGK